MKIFKKALTVVVSVILWVIILLAALYAFTTLATRDESNVANIAGYTPMIVETESMSPTFDAGDLIFIKTCDTSSLKEGDIITFHTIINNEYALNTHRIEEIIETDGVRSYVTKGDNNDISDTHVIVDGDIVGKYAGRLAKVGKVMNILSSSAGFLIIIVLPMLLFFIYQVYHLIMVSINLKKAIAAEEAAKAMNQTENHTSDGNNQQDDDDTEAILAEAKRLKEEAEAVRARAKAQEALAEAKRLKAEAEAQLEHATRESKSGDEE
jgi:signal peptidase